MYTVCIYVHMYVVYVNVSSMHVFTDSHDFSHREIDYWLVDHLFMSSIFFRFVSNFLPMPK